MLAVMGAGNQKVPGDFKKFYEEAMTDPNFEDDIPNEEY